MTQDQPKQPDPEKQTPPTPAPKPTTTQSETAVQKVTQTLEQIWKQVQPVLKVASIKTLRATIGVLEGTVEKLEEQPTQQLQPPQDTLPSAASLPPEMPTSVKPSTVTAAPATPTAPTAPKPASQVKPVPQQSFWARSRTIIINLLVWWQATLKKIRTLLPASVNQKLPNDTALTGAIAAVFIFLFWSISALSSGKPPKVAKVPPVSPTPPPAIVQAPPTVVQAPPKLTASPEVTTPPAVEAPPELTAPPEVTTPPAVVQAPPEVKAPPPVKTPPPIKVPGVKAPPELTAPKPPQPVEIEPPPTPVLTPEQKLIAKIQNQVADITKQYADGLIQSIQANFQGSLLTIKLSDDWYNFDSSKQDKLATDMWRRAQELDFSKLELTDAQGTLLARTPVVGSNMVILKRQILAAT